MHHSQSHSCLHYFTFNCIRYLTFLVGLNGHHCSSGILLCHLEISNPVFLVLQNRPRRGGGGGGGGGGADTWEWEEQNAIGR